jgi:hypothetical protein
MSPTPILQLFVSLWNLGAIGTEILPAARNPLFLSQQRIKVMAFQKLIRHAYPYGLSKRKLLCAGLNPTRKARINASHGSFDKYELKYV